MRSTQGFSSGPNVSQPSGTRVPLPMKRWVDLWQDGVLRLHAKGKTFPLEPEITNFNWLEIGQIANNWTSFQRLWINDLELVKL